MGTSTPIVERLSRAARPTLFDAVAEPDLLISLMLANLMSPTLWDLGQRIQEHIQHLEPGAHARVLSEVQAYVNHHLYHLAPLEMDQLWGLVPLDEERLRLGAPAVDHAIRSIVASLGIRKDAGGLKPDENLVPVIESGLFPEYEYSVVDVIHAHSRHLRRSKHRPFGVTGCADEAILICALAVALRLIPFSKIVILGAPVHYTALLETDGRSCWINGKRESFDREGWREAVAGTEGESLQKAFDARADLDRIITPRGEAVFPARRSTLAQPCLESLLRRIETFFGGRLRQLAGVSTGSIRYEDGRVGVDATAALDRAQSAPAMRDVVRSLAIDCPETAIELSLYGFRDLSVRQPEAYLAAALRGRKVRGAAATCTSIDDAIARTRAIEGTESIFGDRERIALPDEVLLFATGTGRDKSLLLLALIILAEAIPPAVRQDCEAVLTATQSYVRAGPHWWIADRWEKVSPPTELPLVRWTWRGDALP